LNTKSIKPLSPAAKKKQMEFWATILLLAMTFVWGFTFVTTQDLLKEMQSSDIMVWRFGVAAFVMFAINPKAIINLPKHHKKHGVYLGIALGIGYLFLLYGLSRTTATASSFITGLFVVLTPILAGLLLKEPIEKTVWVAVLITTVGLGFLALKGWSIGIGEVITLVGAFFFALHIIGLDKWSKTDYVYGLTAMQIIVVFLFNLITSSIDGGVSMPPTNNVFYTLVFLAVVATCIGYFAQTWVQSSIGPTRTAVILTMEPVFAGIAGVTIGSDILTTKMIIGASLILFGTYLVELGPRHSTEGTHPHLEP
jgi:drug/metabolite transporter (DMT)-like permease